VGENLNSVSNDYYKLFKTSTYSQYCRNNTYGDCVGVYGGIESYGLASPTTAGCNFGVVGTIPIEMKGAGIVGTTEGSIPPSGAVTGSYAGYFYGDTYADGDLTVAYGLYNLSDMRLKKDVVSLEDNIRGSVLNNLQGLDVIEYTLSRPTPTNLRTGKKSTLHDKESLRRHYGVSAQELQQIFPNLVKEGQDGYLTVNYTEMVPILLRCIQELKQEVDELKGTAVETRTQDISINEVSEVKNSYVKNASLQQNTPNPFTERTTIRFTLSENAKNAYIYIFDMTGKMQKQVPVDASMQSITINGYELAAGMYIYSLVVDGKEMDTKRMILSK
jgi:hypothetical protein